MTARHAVETLTLEGYVYRNPRRGTFVAEPRLRFSVGSFTRIMTEPTACPAPRCWRPSTLEPDPLISEMLGIPAGGRVHLLQRLRTAKGEPIAIENIHVSAERFPDLLEHDLTGSLWELLRARYDVHPMKADARVVAVTLDRFEAETLGVEAGESGDRPHAHGVRRRGRDRGAGPRRLPRRPHGVLRDGAGGGRRRGRPRTSAASSPAPAAAGRGSGAAAPPASAAPPGRARRPPRRCSSPSLSDTAAATPAACPVTAQHIWLRVAACEILSPATQRPATSRLSTPCGTRIP